MRPIRDWTPRRPIAPTNSVTVSEGGTFQERDGYATNQADWGSNEFIRTLEP